MWFTYGGLVRCATRPLNTRWTRRMTRSTGSLLKRSLYASLYHRIYVLQGIFFFYFFFFIALYMMCLQGVTGYVAAASYVNHFVICNVHHTQYYYHVKWSFPQSIVLIICLRVCFRPVSTASETYTSNEQSEYALYYYYLCLSIVVVNVRNVNVTTVSFSKT